MAAAKGEQEHVDAIFYVFDHVARPDAVGSIGA
jgi:hypothetical protein